MARLTVADIQTVRCDNPSAMTLEGTNTYLVTLGDAAYVVDPGPHPRLWPEHVRELDLRLDGMRLAGVVLTHRHPDHADAAPELALRHGAPVLCADPSGIPVMALAVTHGETLGLDGVPVMEVVMTPGHTADSICLLLGDGTLLTGDTVLGRGPTVVFDPDGRMADYLETLGRLDELVWDRGVTALRPGHGAVVDRPAEAIQWLHSHRLERLAAVLRAVLNNRDASDEDLVEVLLRTVYAATPPGLQAASRASIRAQLHYLRDLGTPDTL